MTSIFPDQEDAILTRNLKKKLLPVYIGMHTHGNYPIHYHEQVEISLVLEGCGSTIINGMPYQLTPGRMLLLIPHQAHNFTMHGDQPFVQLCCMTDIQVISDALLEPELLSMLIANELEPVITLDDETFLNVRQDFLAMLNEYNQPLYGYMSVMLSKMSSIVVQYIRQNNKLSNKNLPLQSVEKDYVKFLLFLNTHYLEEHVSIEFVSKYFMCSKSYINRMFSKYGKKSFLCYLHELRIRQTVSLLTATHMKISDISAEVGFGSLRSFSRVFRKEMGVTPSEYRQSIASQV